MIRCHDVSQLTTAELERAKRELQANLGMITSHSPAHVPIQAQMRAIDSEHAERAESQKVTGSSRACRFGYTVFEIDAFAEADARLERDRRSPVAGQGGAEEWLATP